jgi:hypothetical protein
MNLNFLKVILDRKDVKVIIFGTVVGAIVQVRCRQYIKSHPESLGITPDILKEVEPEIELKNGNRRFRRLRKFLARGVSSRGGAMAEFSLIAKFVIIFLADNGMLTGFFTATGIVISKIPASAINRYLSDAFAQNLPELEKQKFILVDGEKLYMDQCNQNLKYLFLILKDPTLPLEEKEKVAYSILTKYLDLKTMDGRVNFVLCLVFILLVLSNESPSSFYIILQNLIKAIKEGKISKAVGGTIIRRLQKKGVPIDPALLELINS